MPFADPVVDAGQPCLEVREDEMDDGQKLVGHFGIAAFGNGVVIVTALAQVGVTAPVVRDDQRPRNNRAIDKSAKRFGASVSGDRQPHAPRIAPIVSLVPCGSRLAMAPSTAQATRTLWCMPRSSPRVRPPIQVSSTSTCSFARPPMRSWRGRTIPARSLWRIWKAVS